jgi:hypothetical protein
VKTRLLVLPTVELTTLKIPADVRAAPAGSAWLFAASPKIPPRRTPAGSVIDKSTVNVDLLTANTSHGEGSQTASSGGVAAAGVGVGSGAEFSDWPRGISSLPMRQPNTAEPQPRTANLSARRRDLEIVIKENSYRGMQRDRFKANLLDGT